MRRIFGAATLAAFMGAAPAAAEPIDTATVTCGELLGAGEDSATVVFVWLLGFQGGKSGDPRVDMDALEADVEKIADFCEKNPQVAVGTAVPQALGR